MADGRRPDRARPSHGERTRRDILAAAEHLAAREGVEGLTIGRLAEQVGMSKAGLFAHFGSKEALQIATVDAANARVLDEVFAPALGAGEGAERLARFLDLYFAYLERRAGAGGCFFTAASLELDDRPGPVRDRVVECLRARDALVVGSLDESRRRGELAPGVDVEQLAFEAVALASGAAVAFQLARDPAVLGRARAGLARLFGAAGLRPRPPAPPGPGEKPALPRRAEKPASRASRTKAPSAPQPAARASRAKAPTPAARAKAAPRRRRSS